MKRYRKISYVLGGILFLVVGMLAFRYMRVEWKNAEYVSKRAEVSLKSATELWANREFDKLGIPYSVGGGEPNKESKQRRIVLAEGETVVAVDSIKEGKRLIASQDLSAKVGFLIFGGQSGFQCFE